MNSIRGTRSGNNRRTSRSAASRRRKTTIDRTRGQLAILIVVQGFAVGLGIFLDPVAGDLFDKILPLVTLVLGWYFGSRRD